MNSQSRTSNAIINSFIGIVSAVVTVLLNFAVRIILVRQMGEEINGLHNLFQSIINAMAIIEMGFATAVVILLYKPIKEGNKERTTAIMLFYKRVYQCIACIFAVMCLIVNVFFIDDLVTSSISLNVVRMYFFLFSLTFILNYLTYYKRSILYADQKNRISTGVNAGCELLFRSLQIASILIWQNYYIFLFLMIAEKLASNMICNAYVNKHHPYINDTKGIVVTTDIKKAVVAKVKPLFVNQIATSVHQSSKSILVGLLLGNISIVGVFGNYQLIVSTAQLLFSQFGGAFTSGFGNLAVDNNKKEMYHVYRKTAFLLNSVAILFACLFVCCIQPFIEIAFGDKFLLNMSSVYILVAEMLFFLYSVPIISIQNAMGLHNKDQIYMVAQAIFAIVLAYIGGKYWEMNGILLGVLVPYVLVTYFHKGIIISKSAFDVSHFEFLKLAAVDIVKSVVCIALSFFACSILPISNLYLSLIANAIVASCVCLILMHCMSIRNPYYPETRQLIFKMIKR